MPAIWLSNGASPFWCRKCRAVAISRITKLASCSVRWRRRSIVSNNVPPSIFSNTTKNLSSSSKYSISCRMFSWPRQWWKISISFSTLLRLLCWFFSMIWKAQSLRVNTQLFWTISQIKSLHCRIIITAFANKTILNHLILHEKEHEITRNLWV